jgi:hypothetical protein
LALSTEEDLMATVQDYLNLALSATISNQSKTDVEFQLPNDIRKLTDLKVASWQIVRQEIAAGTANVKINRSVVAQSMIMVFFSHPVSVIGLGNTTLTGGGQNLSFVGLWTDRSDGTDSAAFPSLGLIEFTNDLHSPNYVGTSGGATTAVEMTAVEIELSSTA